MPGGTKGGQEGAESSAVWERTGAFRGETHALLFGPF